MNTIILASLQLVKTMAETHEEPIPLFRLWKAITDTKDVYLVEDAHKLVGTTLVDTINNLGPQSSKDALDVEPYDLDESTLLDQIIADIGDTK